LSLITPALTKIIATTVRKRQMPKASREMPIDTYDDKKNAIIPPTKIPQDKASQQRRKKLMLIKYVRSIHCITLKFLNQP
jgi:hypothetical protein